MAAPIDASETSPPELSTPELSVVVPTYGRPERIRALLARLKSQTLAPERFEVVVTDDGTPEPIALAAADYPFALTLLRQANAGPGPARNLAFEHCRAPLVLILNDDAVPAADLAEGHLLAHADAAPNTAILGTFQFTAEALQSPFVQLLAHTDLLFDFPGLEHGKRYGWTHFWTCNISLELAAIRAVGGFDPQFDRAIVEDVELGYRLGARGLQVEYRSDLVAEHDHVLTAEGYFARGVRLGKYLGRMYTKHRDPSVLWTVPGASVENHQQRAMQATVETMSAPLEKLLRTLESFEQRYRGQALPASVLEQLHVPVRRLSYVPFAAGALKELEGHDPAAVIADPHPYRAEVSIVVVSMDALEQTRACLAALRKQAVPELAQQIVFVDNGSTDGSVEFLRGQQDVELIENPRNLGAPRARNQAIPRCRAEYVVFMDNDVLVTEGWLERLVWHARVDGCSGAVGPLSDRSAHGQQIECGPATRDAAQLSAQRAAEHPRQMRWATLLSSFCVLVRRSALEAVGGFDEWFSPWGFEDDDFTLRLALAGFRNRIALDVFVRHEPYRGRAKAERHSELLQRNWRRFAARWGAPDSASYGDYEWLRPLLEREDWTTEELHRPPAGQTAGDCVLMWPDYADSEGLERELDATLRAAAEQGREISLALRVDPTEDGGADTALAALGTALERIAGPAAALDVQLLDEADRTRALEQARLLCSAFSPIHGSELRGDWLRSCGLPQLQA